MNIIIIGAGALGSRHLQSCLKLSRESTIYVIDPTSDSLSVAMQRAEQIAPGADHNLVYSQSLTSVPKMAFDVLIVATAAAVRLSVLQDFLIGHSARYAVLEKVLFQDLKSYELAGELLTENAVTTFVNCPLRTYPFYKSLRDRFFRESGEVGFKYSGGDWVGMACNTIHYLDLMSFLTNENLTSLDVDGLDDGFIESKRVGNIEFTGELIGRFAGGGALSITSIRGSDESSTIEITKGPTSVLVDELSGDFQILSDNNEKEIGKYELVFQSNLTHKLVEQLIGTGTCELPTYAESEKLHKIMIESMLGHYSKSFAETQETLPIT